jgi:hypothetical protein
LVTLSRLIWKFPSSVIHESTAAMLSPAAKSSIVAVARAEITLFLLIFVLLLCHEPASATGTTA